MKQVITDYIENIHSLCNSLDTEQLNKACELMLESYKSGKQIFVAGNGGSAGTSNHFCCDFGKNAVKGDTHRPKIISLSANIEVLTALGNDFCYAEVFSQQLKNLMAIPCFLFLQAVIHPMLSARQSMQNHAAERLSALPALQAENSKNFLMFA